MPRIAIAGFQHETNSIGVGRAGLGEFEMPDSWPGLLTGADVIGATRGMNIPIAGFAAAAERDPSVELIPILWCAAEPSGPVTDEAYETISGRILDGIRACGDLDGLYLDLHGAMITDGQDDGEGEILRRIRALVGDDLPVSVSLDMHANVSPDMVGLASVIGIYRTYPHLDMADTGARCLHALKRCMDGQRMSRSFRQVPYLIPLHVQTTAAEPVRSLYEAVSRVEQTPGIGAEIALGFTAADTHDTGPSIVAYAPDQTLAEEVADRLVETFLAIEGSFDCALLDPAEAVRLAMATNTGRPVVIADVQDNPGAGASSDTTSLLSALVGQEAKGAIMGLLNDPAIAERAHRCGIGATFGGALGGCSGSPGERPFDGDFRVEALSDGRCRYTGKMYGGGTANLGRSAVLRVLGNDADVRVVVTSVRNQCLDLAHFTHFGLVPSRARIVCVKSTAHFRADFEPIAETVLMVAAPGAFPSRPEDMQFRRLRAGLRLGPRCAPYQIARQPNQPAER